MRLPRPTFANLTALLALFIALGGTSYAVTKLPKGSVGSDQLKSKAVTNAKLATGAVTADKLASGVAMSGPRGPRGAEGPAGPAGPTGPQGAGISYSPWQNLSFIGGSGWDNYGASMQVAQIRRDNLGNVELRGVISRVGGAPAAGAFARVPDGWAPQADHIFGVVTGPPDPKTHGRVDVKRSGDLVWLDGSVNDSTTDYTSLDGIRYATN